MRGLILAEEAESQREAGDLLEAAGLESVAQLARQHPERMVGRAAQYARRRVAPLQKHATAITERGDQRLLDPRGDESAVDLLCGPHDEPGRGHSQVSDPGRDIAVESLGPTAYQTPQNERGEVRGRLRRPDCFVDVGVTTFMLLGRQFPFEHTSSLSEGV